MPSSWSSKPRKCDESEKFSNLLIPHIFIEFLNNIIPKYLCVIQSRRIAATSIGVVEYDGVKSQSGKKVFRRGRNVKCEESRVPPHEYLEGVEDILLLLHAEVMQGSQNNSRNYLQISFSRKGELLSTVRPERVKVQNQNSAVQTKTIPVGVLMSISQVDNLIERMRKENMEDQKLNKAPRGPKTKTCESCPDGFVTYSPAEMQKHIRDIHEDAKKVKKRKAAPGSEKGAPARKKVVEDSILIISQPQMASSPAMGNEPAVDAGVDTSEQEEESQDLLAGSHDPLQDNDHEEGEDDEEVDSAELEFGDTDYDLNSQLGIESEQPDLNHDINEIVIKAEKIQMAEENEEIAKISDKLKETESKLKEKEEEAKRAVAEKKLVVDKLKNSQIKILKVNKMQEETIKKMRDDHSKELARLLDENKKLEEKNRDQKLSIRKEEEKKRERRRTSPVNLRRGGEMRMSEKSDEKDKRSRTRCRYVDNREGCMKSRCEFFHPKEHCRKFLKGSSCLSSMCKFLHRADERSRLNSTRNERKRQREQSPTRRATRHKKESVRVCREWERTGECVRAEIGRSGCREGHHPLSMSKKNFGGRALRRAGSRVLPGSRDQGPSR